jgi:poly-beta-1,6-N-acetyl-D-glucosamine synthase
VPDLVSTAVTWPGYGRVYALLSAHMTLRRIFYGSLVPDLAMTCVVAAIERRPRLLLAAVFFPFMRVLDAAIGLWVIPLAWLARSDGVWKSPTRRGVRSGTRREVPADPVPVTGLPGAPDPACAPEPVAYAEAGGHHAPG